MKICIFGAGAVGGYIAAKLAHSGVEVSVVARGVHLAAIEKNGLVLHQGGVKYHVRPRAAATAQGLGEQDYVFLAVKSPALPEAARGLAPLLGKDTTVVAAMNGIPWWFFHRFGAHDGLALQAIDPGGVLSAAVPPARILGCVLHVACSVPQPGVIMHHNQNRLFLGEIDGSNSRRLTHLVEVLKAAGFDAQARDNIRRDVWVKLLGNMTYAPVSLLAPTTNDRLAKNPGTRAVMARMIDEACAVGLRYGLESDMSTEQRIDLGGSLVGFRTSMLQDMDKGRPVELDTIVRSVLEMGRAAGVETPTIATIYALAALKAEEMGLYKPW
jgi:2-dehydropantoate 2-reductase